MCKCFNVNKKRMNILKLLSSFPYSSKRVLMKDIQNFINYYSYIYIYIYGGGQRKREREKVREIKERDKKTENDR